MKMSVIIETAAKHGVQLTPEQVRQFFKDNGGQVSLAKLYKFTGQ